MQSATQARKLDSGNELRLIQKEKPKLKLTKIQRTCVHDGPGIRTTIFFQGCHLRCLWCQNPESLSFESHAGENYSIDEIVEIVKRDKAYYFSTGGGLTLSGGEPLLQKKESLLSLLKKLKKENINIAVETTLHAPWKNIESVIDFVDLFLVDFKVIGDDELHKKLTKQDSKLIHENLKKLLEKKVTIKYRMVMVPNHNDSQKNIENAAEFLKKIGAKGIELLKYHNMYEEKAKKFGLEVEHLNITPEQSKESLEKGIKLFNEYGIKATNTELEPQPPKAKFSKRVLDIQNDIREAGRALCMEVSNLKTDYYKENGFDKPTPIHRAERLRYVLNNKKSIIYPGELLVGNFTSKRVGGQVWEEQYGVLDITFLGKIHKQKPVPFECSKKEKKDFYFKIFPFWFKHSLLRKANKKLGDFLKVLARSSEMVAGFNNNMAAIAHFIVNFERLLKLGTTGMIKEIEDIKKAKPENNQDFYDGCIIALKALEEFGLKYAEHLDKLKEEEQDSERKKELEKMAGICRRVPKYPASSFHEALQSMLFLQISLCIEAYENAVSYGRVDQFLYPYYKKDLEEGKITYDEAKELLCLFILKIDEVILVNDGDSYLNVSKLFETLSVDQALTFGGVGKDGLDATNDLTYMLIDACELQPLAINMTARIHKNSPKKYLQRLAEIYVNGCPMPELFSDDIYIDSIMQHYDTTIEDARNYSIVGCVEPVASDDHFGNTDCANMNLTLPFLQALKGHEHDLWNYGKREQFEKIMGKFIEHVLKDPGKNAVQKFLLKIHYWVLRQIEKRKGMFKYNPPKDMDELLERFQTRLNHLGNAILSDHQMIEKVLRTDFTTPLASTLYNGCMESGLDVYEGGTKFNTSGIQAVGVTDVADSLYALDEVVFKKKEYTLLDVIHAIDANFEGEKNQEIRKALQAVPKYGDDSSLEASKWVDRVLKIYNNTLNQVPNPPRNGFYTAGYYALNTSDRYGMKTQALPSGRKKGVPLANSIIPHYEMEQDDLLSALNAISKVDFRKYAVNGTTVTFTIDSALFPGEEGINNLSSIFKTFLTTGGMQLQPNIINRDILIEAYHNPEKHKYLMVRVAGYCAYFNELSDDLKKIIINRTCYS